MSRLPLEGVRVLELASVLAGPYAGSLLRMLGAEVVKIESAAGDPFRKWSGRSDSPHFAQYNLGKKSVVLDLRDPRGVTALKLLLPKFDALLESSRPGRMERLGLSASECANINPTLVYVSVSGFGSAGPIANRPSYDGVAQAFAGLLSLTNPPGTLPGVSPAIGDMITGIMSAAAVLAGLVARFRYDDGVRIETSMLEAIVALVTDSFTQWFVSGEVPSRRRRSAQSQTFTVAADDGRFVMIHLSTSQKFFRNLLHAVGREDLAEDPRFATYLDRLANYAELEQALNSCFKRHDADTWEEILAHADVPASVVRTVAETAEHPQAVQLELFGEPVEGGLRYARGPWRVDGQRPPADGRPPRLGEHTDEILSSVLDPDELGALRRDGVIV